MDVYVFSLLRTSNNEKEIFFLSSSRTKEAENCVSKQEWNKRKNCDNQGTLLMAVAC